MTPNYSEEVSKILLAWVENLSGLTNEGKLTDGLVEKLEELIRNGEAGDSSKIRAMIEAGIGDDHGSH